MTDYRIFMAISNKVGQTSRGETIFKKDSEGNPIIKNGQHIWMKICLKLRIVI